MAVYKGGTRTATPARANNTRKAVPEPDTGTEFPVTWTDEDFNKKGVDLICGRSKSGRTMFAATYPKPFFINADKGLKSISHLHAPKYNLIYGDDTHTKLHTLLMNLRAGRAPFDKKEVFPETLVVDTLSAVSQYFEEEVRQFEPESSNGSPRGDGLYLADYNIIQKRIIAFLMVAKDVCEDRGIHFVVTCSTSMEKDELIGGFFEVPLVTGSKLGPLIPTYFDNVYYMDYDAEESKRFLYTRQVEKFPYAGNKMGITEEAIEDPSYSKIAKFYEKKPSKSKDK